jgi:hypothetical protein
MNSRRSPLYALAVPLPLLMAGVLASILVLAFLGSARAEDAGGGGNAKAYVKILTQQYQTKPPVRVRDAVCYYINNSHLKKTISVTYSVLLDGKPSGSGTEIIRPKSSFPVPADPNGKSQIIRIDRATFQ